MYRSIGHVTNKASQPAVSLSKMLFGAKKTARLSLVELREMIGWRLRTTFGAWIKTSLSSVSRKFKKKLNRMKSYQIYDKIEAMQQTGEDHREKYDRSELPSSFMSPETPRNQQFGRTTPSIEAFPSYASCFLTPPCSQEKALRPTSLQAIDLQGLPKLDLELEDGDPEKSVRKGLHRSPLLPEDRIIGRLIGEEKIDFISDLRSINCQKICQKICSYLDPQDLCRYVDGVLYAGAYTDFAVVCVRSTIKLEFIINKYSFHPISKCSQPFGMSPEVSFYRVSLLLRFEWLSLRVLKLTFQSSSAMLLPSP